MLSLPDPLGLGLQLHGVLSHRGGAVGTFNDPSFPPPPNRFYWTVNQHHWLTLPEGLLSMEEM